MKARFHTQLSRVVPRHSRPKIVVACSGGLDSVILLDLLVETYPKELLSVAHVHHGQRPAADEDQAFVEELCRGKGLPLESRRLTLPPGASEAELREGRYAALAEIAGAGDAKAWVAVGHHADDQLETLLHRLMRGAHPSSLRGMQALRKRKETNLFRPLLAFTRAEILDYAKDRALAWREDASNTAGVYTRNRIRHELLPLMESIQPKSGRHILQFFQSLAESTSSGFSEVPDSADVEALRRGLTSDKGVPIKEVSLPVLRAAVERLLDSRCQLTRKSHWESLEIQLKKRLASRRGSGEKKLVQFPGANALLFNRDRLHWLKLGDESDMQYRVSLLL